MLTRPRGGESLSDGLGRDVLACKSWALHYSLSVMVEPLAIVDVVGVGLNATDALIRLPHFPAFGSKIEFTSAEMRAGGQVASAMIACQRWGLRTRYVGKVGDDSAAEMHQKVLRRSGVESHLIPVRNCISHQSVILVDGRTGERTVLWKRDPRLRLRSSALRRDWVTS